MRIAQRAERRICKADNAAKAAIAAQAQRAIRERLAAEIKAKIAARGTAGDSPEYVSKRAGVVGGAGTVRRRARACLARLRSKWGRSAILLSAPLSA